MAKRIGKELTDLMQNPPPGIAVELVDESDLFRWRVLLDGPEGSPYQSTRFAVLLTLATNYPFQPPTLTFLTRIYHPNVYDPDRGVATSSPVATPSVARSSSTPSTSATGATATTTTSTISPFPGTPLTPVQTPGTTPAPTSASTPTPSSSNPVQQPLSTSTSTRTPAGSMCLPLLRPDDWKPSSRVADVLAQARARLAQPDPDDALDAGIAAQMRDDPHGFERVAAEWARRYGERV